MIVNGFWHGGDLDDLSLYCINSWIKNGYSFNLWTYNKSIQVENVVIKDAEELVPFTSYFTYDGGHTAGTPVAFSNYFRAVLLYELGGLYADLDMLCLRPYRFNKKYMFCKQGHNAYDWLESKYGEKVSIGTSIIYTKDKHQKIFSDWKNEIKRLSSGRIKHGDLGPDLFTKLIIEHSLLSYCKGKKTFNPIDFFNFDKVFEGPLVTYGIHLFSSQWKEDKEDKLNKLKAFYGE